MTVEEAIRDLLNISTDIRSVAVLGADRGDAPACGPGAAASGLAAVAVLQADGRRIAALTGAQPAVGLLLFDLRTCLSDAFAEEDPA